MLGIPGFIRRGAWRLLARSLKAVRRFCARCTPRCVRNTSFGPTLLQWHRYTFDLQRICLKKADQIQVQPDLGGVIAQELIQQLLYVI